MTPSEFSDVSTGITIHGALLNATLNTTFTVPPTALSVVITWILTPFGRRQIPYDAAKNDMSGI